MTINEKKGAAECFFEKAITKIISIICNVNDGDKFNAISQKCASAQKLGMNIVRRMDDRIIITPRAIKSHKHWVFH